MLDIKINKDIGEYKRSVALGLNSKELISFALSAGISVSSVLLLKDKIGLVPSCYLSMPVVMPVALNGFYHKNGMNFTEYIKRSYRSFTEKPLVYSSTEGMMEDMGMNIGSGKNQEEYRKGRKPKRKDKKKKNTMFGGKFKQLKNADEPLYATPKSLQQAIEIKSISKSGIFEVADGKYTKTYLFSDINYVTHTRDGQLSLFERWCSILNSFDIPFKITINNKNKDMEQIESELLFEMQSDGFDHYREAYNDIMRQKINEGRKGIEQERYLTVTVERGNFEEAKAYFITFEMNLKQYFMDELGSLVIPLDASKRLQILHDFYCMGEEGEFSFDFEDSVRKNADFRNDICNIMMKFSNTCFEDEKKFGRALFIKKWPSSHSDEFLNELVSVPVHSIISIDSVPIPKDIVNAELKAQYLGVEEIIRKQQQKRNRNNDFASDISYVTRRDKEELEDTMDDIRENDQAMFWTAVTIILTAETKEELDHSTETIKNIAKRRGFQIETYFLRQREALNTALPIGVRQVNIMRTLVTRALAAMMPFHVQELYEKGGNYYGVNQLSLNIILGNRKRLINGNGFVFGVPGAGKSFFVKMEMGEVYLTTNDDIIIIDPQNEYFDIVEKFRGVVINLSADTDTYINPFDYAETSDLEAVIVEKTEFMQGIAEQSANESLDGRKKSIIDRCVRQLFEGIQACEYGRKIPTMKDFFEVLRAQEEQDAQDIALMLERFIEGSLNIFSHGTNVDVENRLMVYGIKDLGEELSAVSMLVMMSNISARIEKNAAVGRATWLYIDELHVLLDKNLAAKFLESLWKKVRKLGGICTGITQNIIDILKNPISSTMVNNSEFTAIMKQSPKDKEKILESIEISEAQLRYVTHAQSGTGLLRHGDVIVPVDVRVEKGPLYHMFNTNAHEKALLQMDSKESRHEE